jgi:hypothetical protein
VTVTLDRPPLPEALGIPGARSVSLLDADDATVLWSAGAGEQKPAAVVALATAATALADPGDELGDVILTSTDAFHVIRLVGDGTRHVAHLTLSRATANLAMARREFGLLVAGYATRPRHAATHGEQRPARKPADALTRDATEAVASQLAEAVAPQSAEAIHLQPAEAAAPQPAQAVPSQPAEAVTLQPAETAAPQPAEAAALQPTEAVASQPAEVLASQPLEIGAPQTSKALAPGPALFPQPPSGESLFPQAPGRQAQPPGRQAQPRGREAQPPGRQAQPRGREAQPPGRQAQRRGREVREPADRDGSAPAAPEWEAPGREVLDRENTTREVRRRPDTAHAERIGKEPAPADQTRPQPAHAEPAHADPTAEELDRADLDADEPTEPSGELPRRERGDSLEAGEGFPDLPTDWDALIKGPYANDERVLDRILVTLRAL